ncbi:hypothetical protein RchiOBHm_Chr7g0179941 [Rosa chinensis]|uniref:Uncharacterized protein n=1 Tax=Rosa chinensis TaxID=74649 RepID=A0A2P6P292_ROSCH|nr:uncharacterized protein LOC112176671 [Rosa chinensis]PRQ16042.1 hypothetical protein RchiOBHm_Chr7g0179941 [Rosa chinensis]
MDEAEKLTALKKAYADIILNTAKEAAARVMVSEKRAVWLQRELLYTKEEALRMLLRLKHTYDSKVGEAEMKSLSQQGKIDELEAQLQEAEDIVSDLRGELSEVQDRLEKAKKRRALDRQNLEVDTTAQEKMSPNGQCFPGMITSQLNLQADVVAINGKKFETYEGSRCYIESDSLRDHNYVHTPEFASIVMTSKEPELYRNGCTQRIRAFERYMFDEKLSLSGLVDDEKHATFIRGNGEGKGMSVTPTPKFDYMHEVEKNLVELKVKHADESHRREKEQLEIEVPAILSFCKKRRRTARNRSTSPSPTDLPHLFTEMRQVSGLSYCTASPTSVNDNGFTGNSAKKSEDKVAASVSSPKSPSDAIEMSSHSAFDMVIDSEVQSTRPWTAQKETNTDKLLTEETELTRQEWLSAKNLEVLACNADIQKDESVLEASHLDDLVASQTESNKFLRYTFHRKRKRETMSMPETNSQNGTLEGKTRETKIGSLQQQKSSLMPASSG